METEVDEDKINEGRGRNGGRGGRESPFGIMYGFYTEHLRPAASVSH